MTRTGDPLEIELKLGVSDATPVRRLLEDPAGRGPVGFAASGPGHSMVVTDRYLDTVDRQGLLERAGFRARLRTTDEVTLLTVKSRTVHDGSISTRTELESPASSTIDPAVWPDSAAKDQLLAVIGSGKLREIGALRQRRLQRDFERNGTTVEISLDDIAALQDDVEMDQRTEIEVEFVSGDPAVLTEIEAALRSIPGIHDALGSKFDFARTTRA
ncbi:MAG: CYTH domain-containing protein [Chloroflexota bacterium]